jgi:hypothetical protein
MCNSVAVSSVCVRRRAGQNSVGPLIASKMFGGRKVMAIALVSVGRGAATIVIPFRVVWVVVRPALDNYRLDVTIYLDVDTTTKIDRSQIQERSA